MRSPVRNIKKLYQPLLARLLLISFMVGLLSPLGLNWTLPVQNAKAAGATITVDKNTDPIGGPVDGDGCTLREAIDNANNLTTPHPDCTAGTGNGDTIVFQGVTNITLSNSGATSEMFLDKNMIIQGPVTLDGGSATRIFHIQQNANVSINSVSFTNGYNAGSGGAIIVENGNLSGNLLNFTGNNSDGNGGAIAVTPAGGSGSLNLTDTNFLNNKATGGASNSPAAGGAIYKTGTGTTLLTNVAFTNNEAADEGGAIYNSGVGNILTSGMTITTNGVFLNNTAHAKGNGGSANTEGGGAIYNDNQGSLSLLSNITFTHNTVDGTDGRGGAIFNAFGATDFIVNQAFFTLNEVNTGANGLGGAIYNRDTMDVIHSSFVDNTVDSGGAGGAIASEADPGVDAFVANSTFSDNQAANAGNGGAIYQFTSGRQLTLLNDTIDSNTAGSGGGLYNNSSALLMGNTIVSNNTGANCAGNAAAPYITDQGHNLEWPGAASCAATVTVGDPKLGSLLPIPPSTGPSAPLNAGSAALNNGDNSICSNIKVMSTDQNLKVRPLGEPNCDIGAVESSRAPAYSSDPVLPGGTLNLGTTPPATVKTGGFNAANVGDDTLNVGLQGGSVATAITGPNAAEFTLTAPAFPFQILAGGAEQPIAVQCTPLAVGVRTATLTFTTNDPSQPTVNYTLQCKGGIPGYGSTPNPGQTLNVGSGTVGAPISANLNVFETGTDDLKVGLQGGSLATAITGANAADFTITTPAFPFTILDGGAAQNVAVQCTPGAVGVRTATLTLTTNDPTQPTVSYTLTCTGLAPAAPGYGSTPNPGGTVAVGTAVVGSSVGTNFSVFETGNATLNVGLQGGSVATAITGANAADFTLTAPAFPLNIADGGAAQNVTVQCTPSAAGARTATLTFTTNDTTQATVSYTLTCTGQVAAVPGYGSTPNPSGTVTVGSGTVGAPISTNFSVFETGNATLTVGLQGGTLATAITGANAADFTITAPVFPINIADGGAAQNVTVQCTPGAAGARTATLTFTTNDPAQATVSYTLACTGLAPATPGYGSTPNPGGTVAVGSAVVGSPVSTNFSVFETGSATLNVGLQGGSLATAITGANAADFTLTAPAFPINIADGGAAQNVTVQCTPAATGARTATLTFTTNDPSQSTVSYTLTCTGQAAATPGYGSTPAPGGTIAVGSSNIGTPVSTNLNVFETGNATLTVGLQGGTVATAITGANAADFTITSPAFPINIADGGAAQNVAVQCTPSAAGARTATLTLTTNDPAQATVTYPLTCTGQAAATPGYGSTPAPSGTIAVGSGTVGAPISTNLNVFETGNATLTVGLQGGSVATAITGANAADFTITAPAFPLNIADGGAAQNVAVQCTPGATGARTATLTLTTNDPAQATVSYTLTCTGLAPATPGYGSTPAPGSTIALGGVVVGNPVSLDLNVFETGNATLTVGLQGGSLATAITGANAADFTITSPAFPLNIADGGAAQNVAIQCTPSAAGARTATLTLTTNDPSQATVSYPLTCTGQPGLTPGYGSTPAPGSTINLNTVAGTATGTSIQVFETGTAQLNITNISLSNNAQFALTTPTSFSIADGGAAQTIGISCNSAVAGSFSTTVTVTHNAPGSPATYTINCNVTPVASNTPGYGSTPIPGSTVNLTGVVNTPVNTNIQVFETGTAQLDITGIALSNTAQFSLLSPNSFSIPDGGASQTIQLQCNSAVPGLFSTTVTVSHNAAGSPAVYTITCRLAQNSPSGTPGYGSIPAPGSAIVVGTPAVGSSATTTLLVKETGTAQLDVQSYTLSGPNPADFSIVAPAFPFSIPDGGANVNVQIQCTPSVRGVRVATLTFVTNAGNQTYRLLCGIGANGSGQQPPADLIAQLRVTPDRVVDNSPDNQVTYTFKVKNVGQGSASGVQIHFPIEPGLTLGYPTFGASQAWISQVTTNTVYINLPNLSYNSVITGSLTFRPNRETPPAAGSEVFTRYEVHYSDPTASNKQQFSNAVIFKFGDQGSNWDETHGDVQLMHHQPSTAGNVDLYTANFFIPNEIVTVWLTKPDGTSVGLPGTQADANGNVSIALNLSQLDLPAGTYNVSTFGNRSEITGSGLLVIPAATTTGS